mmetsp:Transcript_35537/g.78847  ORF Transcript_35537/g.78847 Transcript_35537/m.78847 type:complete len:511 (-) Transcript_35537:481-2013(-)|eukprot:CAMPEP_0202907562 /NCGR_PEP_ID=MMETSP1392-20130828/43056_1 /ASSEMBLY_ACC=CAM_ASM_000868 /TAXON_ID=225041 /ORGANISM="Chlamydomonas chlamydogama, Strain SAG 11-48b" /LENGTH=510 /DNA_ID=CAMNT_0049596521 /DNA_START=86 /DNA_END=1618 /DNA_ORIENTATION=-
MTTGGFFTLLGHASSHLKELLSPKHNLIYDMSWEIQIAASAGFSISQLRFALAFLFSVPLGAGIRLFRNKTARHLYALVTGVLLVYYPFGDSIIQAFPPAILTYLAILVAPRRCGSLAWFINFPYLIWLHVVNASGASWNEGQIDFTGCDMVLVLKLIALAVCYQDSYTKKPEALSAYQAEHKVSRLPSPLEYLSYIFSLGTLLGGPFIEYTEYSDFISCKGVWDTSSGKKLPNPLLPATFLAIQAIFFLVAHVALDSLWGVNAHALLHIPFYANQPLMVRWFLASLCGMIYQLKYYYAWKLTEAALTAAGINFLKWSELGRPVWGRCSNASVVGMMFADSGRMIPLNWNIQTGNFLRRYVYERLPARKGKPGFVQLLVTQVVSAIWHGLYAGYLMFFVSTVFFIQASTVVFKAEQVLLPAWLRKSWLWWGVKVLYTAITVNHIVLPFVVLDFPRAWAIWKDVHFVPHIVIFSLLALGQVLPKPKRSSTKQHSREHTQENGHGQSSKKDS